jgi:hypothetical protein
MISRRSFVTTSLAAATVSASATKSKGAMQASSNNGTNTTKQKRFGPEKTARRLIVQKLKKAVKDPSYRPFQSGELVTSMRFVFEHMRSTGLTSQIEAHIQKNGLRPVTEADIKPHLKRLIKQGVAISADMQQVITKHFTDNAAAKSTWIKRQYKFEQSYRTYGGCG